MISWKINDGRFFLESAKGSKTAFSEKSLIQPFNALYKKGFNFEPFHYA